MKLRTLGCAALMACALASCSTIKALESASVSQKSVAAAVQAFDGVETTATNYLNLPTCATGQSTASNACKKTAVVPTLVKDIRAGRAARDSLWAASKANSSSTGLTAAYNAVMAAVATIQTDLSK